VASIRKRGRKWHAQIRRKGQKSITRSFATKGAASIWTRKIEYELDVSQNPDDISVLRKIALSELIKRYGDTVTPTKKSRVQERRERSLTSPDYHYSVL
jgi:hypothetical protein